MTTLDTGTDQLLCRIDDAVATITLNRPEKRNALSNEMTPALRQTLLRVATAPEVRCIVVTGAGAAFCAGGDVSGMGADNRGSVEPGSHENAVAELIRRQETLTLRLYELGKPTIAALSGPAAGAGFALALACDLRIATRSAFITTAFANIGLPGDYGGSWLLTQLVGPAKAKELYFTSPKLSADECLALGIVNEVVDDDNFRERVSTLARTIAEGPSVALGYMKANINAALTGDLKTCLATEADQTIHCMDTDDHAQAVQSFLAKRTPKFRGR